MNEELRKAVTERERNIARALVAILELADGLQRGPRYDGGKLEAMLRQWAKILVDNV